MGSLVRRAQQVVDCAVNTGDTAVDATLGNGHDTLFLASRVGKQGIVYGFDVQPVALEHTHQRLLKAGQDRQVILLNQGHENLEAAIPASQHGSIAAVMFNLGYLPGNDKSITTQTATTLLALEQAAGIVKVGGVIVIVAYTGHPGGDEETLAVKACVRRWSGKQFTVDIDSPSCDISSARQSPPELIVIKKRA